MADTKNGELSPQQTLQEATAAAEIAAIQAALKAASGNVTAAAEALGTPYRTLTWKIRKLGLRPWLEDEETFPDRGAGGRAPGGAPKRAAKKTKST